MSSPTRVHLAKVMRRGKLAMTPYSLYLTELGTSFATSPEEFRTAHPSREPY